MANACCREGRLRSGGSRLTIRTLDLSDFDQLIDGAKLLSFAAMSNVLGTFTPVKDLTERAHELGLAVHADASQYTPIPAQMFKL